MVLALTASIAYGGANCVLGGYLTSDLFGAVIGAVSAPALVYLYVSADSPEQIKGSKAHEIGRCAASATIVLSCKNLIPSIDLSIPIAFIITLIVTYRSGVLRGAIYGLVCGCVLSPALAPMYAISAMITGLLWSFSPAVAIAAACAASCAWSVYAEGFPSLSTTVPHLIITSAITAPIMSSRLINAVGKRVPQKLSSSAADTASLMFRRETSRKMRSLSDSMSDLSGVLYRLSDTVTVPCIEELCEICEGAFDESCKTCSMKSACFGREEAQTTAIQRAMVMAMKRDGRVSAALVSQPLAKRCYNMGQIIDRMNAGCAKLISEAKLYDRTGVVAADYEVMSEMLRESSEYDSGEFEPDTTLTAKLLSRLNGELRADSIGVFGTRVKKVIATGLQVNESTPDGEAIRDILIKATGLSLSEPNFELDGSKVIMKLTSESKFRVRCGRASVAVSELKRTKSSPTESKSSDRSDTKVFSPRGNLSGIGKTSSEACGDVISAFKTPDERFFMLISDGMGSGKEAALTSGVCVMFIEKLLKAGASMDTSLKMLNSMMRVRGNEISATVDLMELDLMNGKIRFVKSGAAPSFVLRDGRLFRLQSKTVPIGIVRALDAEMIKFEAESGDVIVMLSDGVVRSFEDCPWLYDLLCDEREWTSDAEAMARKIVKHAIKNGAEDDITAGIVMVE